MPTDTERLDFLSRSGSFVRSRTRDIFQSNCPRGKSVQYMVDGVSDFRDGETLREAVDAAMEAASLPKRRSGE